VNDLPGGVPPASIVIPTRARPAYLETALASIAPQASAAGAEIVVVDDAGPSSAIRDLADRFGARYEPHERPLGLNVARNTGVERSRGELVVFVDDDVEVCPGWLAALLRAAHEHPDAQVFAGPIRSRLEGRAPRSCGREGPPITALDLGAHDTAEVRYAWGANMAVRRAALARVGPFDVSLADAGDEQEWQDRMAAALGPGRTLYVADAALHHRRSGADARLRALARAARARGRAARRFDAWRAANGAGSDAAPSLKRELHTLAGCVGHVVRRRCPSGLTMVAHSAGRVEQLLRERRRPSPAAPAPVDDFLSGESGTVGGLDAVRRELRDRAVDAREVLSGRRLRLARAARRSPPRRRVLAIGVARPEHRALSAAIEAELTRSRHDLELRFAPPGEASKFENLNRLLGAEASAGGALPDHDWLLVIDDDVALPHGFLDRMLFLAERFELALVQPAHRARSHAAWRVTRRVPGAVARETPFVEIGPVTAFARTTFPALLPFPDDVGMGWGLDLHWGALARAHGWRCGVLDAVAISHSAAPIARAYAYAYAVNAARTFLAQRPYVRAREAQTTLRTHRRW
jgi:GT2 family glycosyltransferase